MTIQHIEKDFEEWIARLREAGFEKITATCETCNGSGETLCPHCGDGFIDCEDCNGNGETEYPNFTDYIKLRTAEEKLFEMWRAGQGLHLSKGNYATLQITDRHIREFFSFSHSDADVKKRDFAIVAIQVKS